jgi:sugar lactone lactonase YvrE
MTKVTCVLDAKTFLGEGPLWDVAEQRLYWIDIKRREIHRFDPASGEDEKWSAPEDIGSLAVREQGGLIVALSSGFYRFDLTTAQAELIVDPEPDQPQNRFNDGKPDRRGRFWAGSMHDRETEPTGSLYRLDPDGSCQRMVDGGLAVSNSLCWSPDDRVLYHSCSLQRTVWAWDFDADDGTISNRRELIKLNASDGAPDGATVDAEGYLWIAIWGGWRIDRYAPDGRLHRSIELPVQCPTCPAFGGPDLDILYVTSASNRLDNPEKQPQAGGIFAVDAGVGGLPEMRFRG